MNTNEILKITLVASILFANSAIGAEEKKSMPAVTSGVKAHLFRLKPGQNLLDELKNWAKTNHIKAGSILSVVGSLTKTTLRFANEPSPVTKEGHFEIVSLTGTINEDSLHLHAAVSTPKGETIGGHLTGDNIIYTTAEIAIAEYTDAAFTREKDETFGYNELVVKKK
jgi:hypothetical protein